MTISAHLSAFCNWTIAAVPAYPTVTFWMRMVGAIHGALIAAGSAAGIVGPALIATLRPVRLDHGVAPNLVYDRTLYIMALLLCCGSVCNCRGLPVALERAIASP